MTVGQSSPEIVNEIGKKRDSSHLLHRKKLRRRRKVQQTDQSVLDVDLKLSRRKAMQIADLINELFPNGFTTLSDKLDAFLDEFAKMKTHVSSNGSSTVYQAVDTSITSESRRITCHFNTPLQAARLQVAQQLINELDSRLYSKSLVTDESASAENEQFFHDADGVGGVVIAESAVDTPNANRLPNYEKASWSAPLSSDLPPESEQPDVFSDLKRLKNLCFNCSGDHSVKDCPEPRDIAEIEKNRRSFLKKCQEATMNKTRYHADEDPKFAKYKAGVLSAELRQALGLRDHQLPPWIYEMRVFGTPPGYIIEAAICGSSLAVYDKDGNRIGDEFAEGQDEIDISHEDHLKKIEMSLIPEWPGFNVPTPEDVSDEAHRYRKPQISHQQSKKAFEARVQRAKMDLKKKKRSSHEISSGEDKSVNSNESPHKKPRISPVAEATVLLHNENSADKDNLWSYGSQPSFPFAVQPNIPKWDVDSPKISNGNTDSPSVPSASSSDDCVIIESTDSDLEIINKEITVDNSPPNGEAKACDADSETVLTDKITTLSRSVSIEFGTPTIPVGLSRIKSTPVLEKFAEGIQPFEFLEETPPLLGKGFRYLRKALKDFREKFKS